MYVLHYIASTDRRATGQLTLRENISMVNFPEDPCFREFQTHDAVTCEKSGTEL